MDGPSAPTARCRLFGWRLAGRRLFVDVAILRPRSRARRRRSSGPPSRNAIVATAPTSSATAAGADGGGGGGGRFLRNSDLHLLERQAVVRPPAASAAPRRARARRRCAADPDRCGRARAPRGTGRAPRQRSAAVMDFGEPADGGEIFGRALEHELELGLRVVEQVQLEERAAERDAGREIAGMDVEPGAADVDRFLDAAPRAGILRRAARRRSTPGPSGPGVEGRRCESCRSLARSTAIVTVTDTGTVEVDSPSVTVRVAL